MELKDLKLGIKDIPWKEFFGGGILFSIVKLVSKNINDIRIASLVGAFPVGLILSLIIDRSKLNKYSYEYIINLFVILTISLIYHFLLINDFSIYVCVGISISIWAIINFLRIKYTTI